MCVYGLDWVGPGQRQVADACECGNEPSGSVKCGEFLDQLQTSQLLYNFEVSKFHCSYILIIYILDTYFVNKATGILATGWTVRESSADGSEIFRAVRTIPGVNPPRCTMGTGSFPGVMWSESRSDHPPTSSAG